jgi:hypothetical protein
MTKLSLSQILTRLGRSCCPYKKHHKNIINKFKELGSDGMISAAFLFVMLLHLSSLPAEPTLPRF